MRVRQYLGMISFGLMVATANAQLPSRMIIVVSTPDDPLATQQHAALNSEAAALRERDVLVRDITPEAVRCEEPGLAVASDTSFEVLLVGRDGGVKLRSKKPVAVSEIMALIDTMPMRQAEMKQKL